MNTQADIAPLDTQHPLRSIAVYSMVSFLIIIVLTGLYFAPKIREIVETLEIEETQIKLATEAGLFTNYVEGQRAKLEDMAKFPSFVNAVMLSEAEDPAFLDLIENIVIGGERARLVLQDIEGAVIFQSVSYLQGSYGNGEAWVEELLAGIIPYHFQLLGQAEDEFTFKISIPIKYNDLPEGVLSAEITSQLDQVFLAKAFNKRVAFKLVQGETIVATNSSQIELAREHLLELELPELTFVYITDATSIRQKEASLRNTVLMILLAGLAISFLLFAFYGYRVHPKDKITSDSESFSWRTYILPIVVSAIGIGVSVLACLLVYNAQQASIKNALIALGREHVQTIKEKINLDLDVLNSATALYHASEPVSRSEFDTFATIATNDHPHIFALAWIPNVPSGDRSSYIDRADTDGLKNYEFKEIGTNNRLKLAGERDRYFPIFFVSPIEGNEKVLGFDMGSNESRLSALLIAARSGNQVSTAPIELVEESVSTLGVLVYDPIYRDININAAAVDDEFRDLAGFVQLVLRAEDVLSDSVQQATGILTSHVQDVTDPSNPQRIYGDPIAEELVTHSQIINVAGRTWRVDTSAIDVENHLLWIPWAILVSGLAITALMAASISHLINRRRVVEVLVNERTAELKMLSSIAANSNDIFIITDANTSDIDEGGLKILYVNDAFTRVTGFGQEEAIGATPRLLHGSDTDKKQIEMIQNSLKRGEAHQGELLSYTKNKKMYWADNNIFPIKDESGEVRQFAIIQRDVTDRKESEQEREKLIDKLTDSNEELARFAFVCSHDLQEPLRMIRSFSEKLQTRIADKLVDDEKGQRYFRYVTDGAARAQDLIADILSYSSIDNDTQKLQITDGNELLEGVKSTMHDVLQECGGTIIHDDIPKLQGNKTQLHQLFQNLINNAIKYRAADIAPRVYIGVSDMGALWKFSVKDNGIGMEQRHLKKIFDVFQRLHRKNSYAGTGIGLSICKKVVERHGGKIWVESEAGVGSTFYFTIAKVSNEETMNEQQRKAG